MPDSSPDLSAFPPAARPVAATGLNPASPLARLLSAPMRPGRVEWIGVRPARRVPLLTVDCVRLDPQTGLRGDHARSRGSRPRQITLIQSEHVAAIARYLGRDAVTPGELRRNLVVSGINLLALRGGLLRVGTALLELTGECHPCSRMEEVLGPGGYNAVRGHGGATARIIEAGEIRIGDAVARAECGPAG